MWKTFSRSQIAAIAATLVDYGILTFWVEILHQYYPYGVALGASLGAVTNFFLNRYWSFEASADNITSQAGRYCLVSLGSLALNTIGTYLLTEKAGLFYLHSKILISIIIALLYNYPLQRFYVYRKEAT